MFVLLFVASQLTHKGITPDVFQLLYWWLVYVIYLLLVKLQEAFISFFLLNFWGCYRAMLCCVCYAQTAQRCLSDTKKYSWQWKHSSGIISVTWSSLHKLYKNGFTCNSLLPDPVCKYLCCLMTYVKCYGTSYIFI